VPLRFEHRALPSSQLQRTRARSARTQRQICQRGRRVTAERRDIPLRVKTSQQDRTASGRQTGVDQRHRRKDRATQRQRRGPYREVSAIVGPGCQISAAETAARSLSCVADQPQHAQIDGRFKMKTEVSEFADTRRPREAKSRTAPQRPRGIGAAARRVRGPIPAWRAQTAGGAGALALAWTRATAKPKA